MWEVSPRKADMEMTRYSLAMAMAPTLTPDGRLADRCSLRRSWSRSPSATGPERTGRRSLAPAMGHALGGGPEGDFRYL